MLTLMECDFCGQPLPEGARFCPNCGTPVSTTLGTEERKIVTVLFADLVDSTGLAQRLDPERAREVLGGFFDAASEELRALRGHPEKFIGDAVMAVFGLPHVSEDDAVRAVRAGLAIRDRMHRLQQSLGLDEPLEVRVGVETGEAATGVGPTGQLLVTGQVVNAAARLQTAAQPGQVLMGATTHALTEDAVSFGERQEVEAKGFADALTAYPVEALTTRSARRTIPFVGRANELDILRGSVARVNATSSPLLVSILGEPGVGKSRLADELIAGLGDDVTVLRGRAEAYGDTATFAPVTAIVRDIAGIDDEMAPEEAMRRLQEVVDGCCDPSEAERVAGRLGLTIGLGAPKREESVFVQDVQSGFLSLVEGLSARGPVVLVFEDVHGLRPPMLDLIERVVTTTRNAPQRALTIALGRPELLEERPVVGIRRRERRHASSRPAPRHRGRGVGPRGGRRPRRRARGHRDRGADGRQPVLHRGDDRHGPSRPPGRSGRLGPSAPADRAGRRGRSPGQPASSAARPRPARLRLHLLLRPRGAGDGLGRRRRRHPWPRRRRDPRTRRGGRERRAGGSVTRPSARWRTRASPNASA